MIAKIAAIAIVITALVAGLAATGFAFGGWPYPGQKAANVQTADACCSLKTAGCNLLSA